MKRHSVSSRINIHPKGFTIKVSDVVRSRECYETIKKFENDKGIDIDNLDIRIKINENI